MSRPSPLTLVLNELRDLRREIAEMREAQDQVVDIEEASKILGISVGAIYKRTCARNGELPELESFKQGKKVYFRRSALATWATQNRRASLADVEAIADRVRRTH